MKVIMFVVCWCTFGCMEFGCMSVRMLATVVLRQSLPMCVNVYVSVCMWVCVCVMTLINLNVRAHFLSLEE